MRAFGLGIVCLVGTLGACTVYPPGSRGTGATPFHPVFLDASAGTIFPPDASTGPVYSDACWASSLPAPVQPIPPHTTVMDACAAGAAAASTDWVYPNTASKSDDRQFVVGRWAVCNQSIFGLTAHAGLEFGANGRWRMLAADATTGDLVPMARSETTSGYYYMIGGGQLILVAELPNGYHEYPITFTEALDAINFNNPAGLAEVYARTTPSPLNGADNPPPTAAGPCSMVGDWELPSSTGGVGTAFSFDAAGNMVSGTATADLCQSSYPFGTYALMPGAFEITSNGGGCNWWGTATYQAAFDASCSQLALIPQIDNCTGGRIYFSGPTTLTRRPAGCCGASTATTP
jgi:hypothetical protein